MRIAIFTETFRPSVNGIVTRLEQTLPRLAEAGDRILLVAPAGGPEVWAGGEVLGIPSFPLPLYPEIGVAIPRPEIRGRLERFRPDLIHAVNPALLGLAAVHYARVFQVPLIASFHTNLPGYLHKYRLGAFEPLAWELLRSIHNTARVNLAISEPTGEDLIKRGMERVRIGWRGGVDTTLFHPGQADAAVRSRLSAGSPESPLLLYVGRLGAEKSIELLRPILEGVPGARLAIVGDGPHRPALEAHFSGLPVFFAGYLRGAELAAAYASADAFVFPSATDTLGLVLLEAMASGLPVAAARAGGIPDLVADGRSGLLFEPGDAGAAAAAVRRLLEPSAERAVFRVNGRLLAGRWSWQAAAADLRSIYEAALLEAGSRAA